MYLHVNNLQKKYSITVGSRAPKLGKDMLGFPESTLCEEDRYRLLVFAVIEAALNKTVPLNDRRVLTACGFDLQKRSLGDTVKALHACNLVSLFKTPPKGRPLKGAVPDKKRLEEAKDIVEHWNSKKIVVHRIDNENLALTVHSKLKSYSCKEIKAAIDNYAKILHGKGYYWSYAWGLRTFLRREHGFEKFLPGNFDDKQYRARKGEKTEEAEGYADFENE